MKTVELTKRECDILNNVLNFAIRDNDYSLQGRHEYTGYATDVFRIGRENIEKLKQETVALRDKIGKDEPSDDGDKPKDIENDEDEMRNNPLEQPANTKEDETS
jgi:hypothetical protein